MSTGRGIIRLQHYKKRRLWGSFVDRQGKRPGLIESGGLPGHDQFRKKMLIISATATIPYHTTMLTFYAQKTDTCKTPLSLLTDLRAKKPWTHVPRTWGNKPLSFSIGLAESPLGSRPLLYTGYGPERPFFFTKSRLGF